MSSDPTISEEGGGPGGSPPPSGAAPAAGCPPTVSEENTEVPLPLGPGASFLDYAVERRLEVASGEADLWIVRHSRDGGRFILKVYRRARESRREWLEKVRNLDPSVVVKVHAAGELGGRPYEIQEFLPCGSMAEAFPAAPWEKTDVLKVVSELHHALTTAQAAGLLYLDLKPSNVLVRSKEPLDLVLNDFGLTVAAQFGLRPVSGNRTPAYMAPEALARMATEASDWWSLGILLLELFTGRKPFEGMDPRSIELQLATRDPEVPSTLDARWRDLLQGLLTRDHANRWGSSEVKDWIEGRAVLLKSGSRPPSQPTSTQAFTFAGASHIETTSLGRALAGAPSDGRSPVLTGSVAAWTRHSLGNPSLADHLDQIRCDEKLLDDHKVALSAMALDPSLPFALNGELVDPSWMESHPKEAAALLDGSFPYWISRLRRDQEMLRRQAGRQEFLRDIRRFARLEPPLDAEKVERFSFSSASRVAEAALDLRARFQGCTCLELHELFQKDALTFAEGVALLACDAQALLLDPPGTQDGRAVLSAPNSLGMRFAWVPGAEARIGTLPVRVRDYERFVQETHRPWPKPPFPLGRDEPAVNVTWEDARAFCVWLTRKEHAEGRLDPAEEYRLPTDTEWSAAVGLPREDGATPRDRDGRIPGQYPWGSTPPPPRAAGNFEGVSADEHEFLAPVGSYPANLFGLHDLGGNVWEWCLDYHNGVGGDRVLRGASWRTPPSHRKMLESGFRLPSPPTVRRDDFGFRCVRSRARAQKPLSRNPNSS